MECKVFLTQRHSSLLISARFLWASLVLDVVLNDCFTSNQVKDAILRLPTDLEKLYVSCLGRKRGYETLCNPMTIMFVCAAPKPIRAQALCQLLALDMNTGEIASGDVMSSDAVIQRGVGLITLDKTEQLILPAHDSVRTFIFSTTALAITQDLLTSLQISALGLSGKLLTDDTYGNSVQLHLGNACLLHIEYKTSRSLIASSSQTLRVSPKVTPDMPAWIRKPIQAFWPDALDRKTVRVKMTPRTHKVSPQQDDFLEYARHNWLACNQHMSSSVVSAQSQLFSSIAMERDETLESWELHPWPVLVLSRAQHLAGIFAYSVANGNLPLLELTLKHKDSLPRDIFSGLLPNHEHLPAVHVACRLGYFRLIPSLLTVCDLYATCNRSRTALHYAAESGHVECVKHLISLRQTFGQIVDRVDSENKTALHLALLNGHVDLASSLIKDFLADVFLQDSSGTSSFDLALDQGLGEFVLGTYSRLGLGRLLQREPGQEPPLVSAAKAGKFERARTLCWLMCIHIQMEAEVGLVLDDASTRKTFCRDLKDALRGAVNAGHADVVLVLLESDLFVQAASMPVLGLYLPFSLTVSGYYYRGSLSLQGAAAIVALLVTVLTSLDFGGSTGQVIAEQTWDPAKSGRFAKALEVAAEIGQIDTVRQLLDLRNGDSLPEQSGAGQKRSLTSYLEKRGVGWKVFANLGIDEISLALPAFLAAVRQHEGVLALLLPEWDELHIKELMAKAQSIELGDVEPPFQEYQVHIATGQ
jgi:hypothetical protein